MIICDYGIYFKTTVILLNFAMFYMIFGLGIFWHICFLKCLLYGNILVCFYENRLFRKGTISVLCYKMLWYMQKYSKSDNFHDTCLFIIIFEIRKCVFNVKRYILRMFVNNYICSYYILKKHFIARGGILYELFGMYTNMC